MVRHIDTKMQQIYLALCKTAVSPLLTHWRYCILALSRLYYVHAYSRNGRLWQKMGKCRGLGGDGQFPVIIDFKKTVSRPAYLFNFKAMEIPSSGKTGVRLLCYSATMLGFSTIKIVRLTNTLLDLGTCVSNIYHKLVVSGSSWPCFTTFGIIVYGKKWFSHHVIISWW